MFFLRNWKILLSGVLVLLVASGALAQKELVQAGKPRAITPLRMARIDANGKLAGPWIAYKADAQPRRALSVAFDCFEADSTGMPTELPEYGPAINTPPAQPGSRYYFGPGYQNKYCANDMRVAAGMESAQATRVDLAWYWEGAPGEHCYLAVFTAETFGNTSAGPSFTDPYDGVIYDFGTSLGTGFYISRVDLSGGLFHQMPADGTGAYLLVIANQVSEQGMTLASVAQPMLWVTKVNNPSFQDVPQWDDDNPVNGQHDAPAEFYTDYIFPISDRPFGAMIAFYADSPAPAPFHPLSFIIDFGVQIGGNVQSLESTDSNYLQIRQEVFRSRQDPAVRVRFFGTAPAGSGSSMNVKVVGKTSAVPAEQLTLSLEMWSFQSNSWVSVASGVGSGLNSTLQGNTPNLADFLGPNREVRCRVSGFEPGTLLTRSWSYDIDEVTFTINP